MMSPIASRLAVVAAAREWIGTPYHNCADIKGVGVDCGMLLVRVFVDLGLVEPFDPRPYAPDWHLHRSDEKYLTHLLARARRVATPRPGDVIVFRYGRCFSHGGVVTRVAPLTIVHAFHPAKIVLEEEVGRNAELSTRLSTARVFSCWSDRA
jgi:NlpC/P60 family putative phage cell wall peptidase